MKLSRNFGVSAIALAVGVVWGAQDAAAALSTRDTLLLNRLGDAFSQSLTRAFEESFVRPDMVKSGLTAIEKLIDWTDQKNPPTARNSKNTLRVEFERFKRQIGNDVVNQIGNDVVNWKLVQIGVFYKVALTEAAELVGTPDAVHAKGVEILREMISGLDNHSAYLTPKEFTAFRATTAGAFGGLGIQYKDVDGAIVVERLHGGPAARAGIQKGDIITHVNGRPLAGMPVDEAANLIRGEVGSKVNVSISRNNNQQDMSLVREEIKINPVSSRMLTDAVGYVRLDQFSEQAARGIRAAAAELNASAKGRLRGLILDLRGNPGGLLSQSVEISDMFLRNGLIVRIGRGSDDGRVYVAEPSNEIVPATTPVVLLTDSGSASASEIVAGALRGQGRAVIVGTNTYGKGTVQTVIPLQRDTGALKITTAGFYTPEGWIQQVGIAPDILYVDPRQANESLRGEFGKQGSIANPDRDHSQQAGKTNRQCAGRDETKFPLPASMKVGELGPDYQLACAHDYITGLQKYTVTVRMAPTPK